MREPKRENLLALFAGLVAAAAPAYLLRFSIASIPTTVLEILIYFFVVLVVVDRWGKLQLPPKNILWPIFLFLVAVIGSTIIAPDKRSALGILKAWIFDPLLFAWAIYQFQDRWSVAKSVITGLVTGGLVVASIAIVQHFVGQVTVDGRVIGPYAWSAVEHASPNYLALYLAPIGVLLAGIGIGSLAISRKRGVLSLLGAVLLALAIYFSFSRGGLAAFTLGTGSILVMQFWHLIRARKIVLIGLGVILIMLLFAAWLYIRPNPALAPEEGGRITASNNVRWEIWKTTVWEVIPNSPLLGVGLGNFQDYFTELTRGRVNYDRIAPLALTPHNFFLAVWVNLGLLGLLATLWLLVEAFRRSWESLQYVLLKTGPRDQLAAWLIASLVGAQVTLLSHGLLDTPYFKNDLSLLFWTLVALMVLLVGKSSHVRTETKNKA